MGSINAHLIFEGRSKLIQDLKKLPSIKQSLVDFANSLEVPQDNVIEVKQLLILEDLYGNKSDVSDNEYIALCKGFIFDVFSEKDLKLEEGVWLGKTNYNFLKWLKSIAKKNAAKLSVSYQHERGDWLYEEAHWNFDYRVFSWTVEEFRIANYDGLETPEWVKTVRRSKLGKVNFISE